MQKNRSKSTNKNRILYPVIAAIVIIFLLMALFIRGCNEKKTPVNVDSAIKDTSVSIVKTDSVVKVIDTLTADSGKSGYDSVKVASRVEKPGKINKKTDTAIIDSAKTVTVIDTVQPDKTDSSFANADSASYNPCNSDTTSPWVYTDPSGGQHEEPLKVVFVSTETASIRWRIRGNAEWNDYDNKPVSIDTTLTIEYTAQDSCGNKMEQRAEYYEISRRDSKKYCPQGMEYIKTGEKKFCIDKYEWPNRKGAKPEAYISKYGASDSCYSAGKRLCTSDEWMLACMGPYSWKYPYGQLYERYACSTHDTKGGLSGSKPECRSFFGVYDMSGSLAEWTDTRSMESRQFYYVMGGFWESGPQANCLDKRYSYYPQNRHNPVGFRCCADASVNAGGK